MRLKRPGATIAAGLLAGAVALGFGTGAAQADPVAWSDAASTTAELSMGDDPAASRDLPTGTFDGEVDADAGTITGEADHPDFAIEIDNPLGDGEIDLTVHLGIEDIDLDWNQDDGTVEGTATMRLSLLEVGLGTGIDLGEVGEGCVVHAPMNMSGTYDGTAESIADGDFGELVFGGDIGEIELVGECGGLAAIIQGQIGDISGSVVTTVGEPAPEPEPEPEEPEETTTTTEAPAGETPNGGGAAPIVKSPSYTG